MSGVDISGFVDLRLYDRTPQDLVDAAVAHARDATPDWTPSEAQIEMVLTEGFAVMVAEAVFAINRVPGAVMESFLILMGQGRDAGAQGVGAVTFTISDPTGYTIYAGTRVSLPIEGLETAIVLETTSDLAIPGGATTGVVAVATVENTSAANGTLVGTILPLIDTLPLVDSVVVSTSLTDGRDVEDGFAFLSRAAGYLQTLTDTIARPDDFRAAAEAQPGISRVVAIDDYDPAVGPVGSNAGHITVAGLDSTGTALSSTQKATLLTYLTSRAAGHLTVHVTDPTITTQPVTATVKALPDYTTGQVQSNCQDAVLNWLSPTTWPWAGTIRKNTLIGVLSNAEGVDYVVSVTTPASDIAITGAAPLAAAGTIAITVT